MSLEQFAARFGVTVAQCEALRAHNRQQIAEMYAQACRTGRKVSGYTREQLRQLLNGLEIPARRPVNRVAGRWGMVWRKEFVPGAILDGLTIWDRLEFVDRWHCAQWLKGVRRNIRKGRLEWKFDGRPATARVVSSVPYGWASIEGGSR